MSQRKRVYIAEDYPSLVELLKAAFTNLADYETEFFSDGLELYLKVQEDPPDFLLIDIILPTISGLAITRLLKYHDSFSQIPVIVYSSITDPKIKEKALAAGADVFIHKPFKISDLLEKMEKLLKESEVTVSDKEIMV